MPFLVLSDSDSQVPMACILHCTRMYYAPDVYRSTPPTIMERGSNSDKYLVRFSLLLYRHFVIEMAGPSSSECSSRLPLPPV